MQVSVVIINYNTFDLTCNCIRSIYSFTNGVEFEIILVDNNSSEVDPKKFLNLFPNIILIESNVNIGFAGGNNLGIKYAKGDFILLLNSDTYLIEDAITKVYKYISSNPLVGVASPRLIFPSGKHQSAAQRFPSITVYLLELTRIQKLLSEKVRGQIMLGHFFNNRTNLEVDWVWGTFFMFRKEILLKLPNNKLDDQFFMYCEDTKWCWDIKKLGYQIHFCGDAEVVHIMGGSAGKKNIMNEKNRDSLINQMYSGLQLKIIRFLEHLLKIS